MQLGKVMEIVDANVVLRYLLGDVEELHYKSCKIIDETEDLILLDVVIAEIVYVLKGVYKLDRLLIAQTLAEFLNKKNILCKNENIILNALTYYSEYNIDFVDAILTAYSITMGSYIHTFDNKLQKIIN